jgi:hypothetical protein
MSKRRAAKTNSMEDVSREGSALTAWASFQKLDGHHPWQEAVPEGCVLYPVRKLERGQVAWFNFALAREMGLIDAKAPDVMTPELHDIIIETFSLQIVNEWDQNFGAPVPARFLKSKPYMATRYLQLQHADKQGRTSGDGRGIWNGSVKHRGRVWDVSSRGTGVTQLAPGAVEAQKPLKTGAGEFGYGCGLADVSELIGSAIFSEIFHLNGLGTERVLAIIDLGKGVGIGVRAAPNLLRPAHLFLWLKQGEREALRRGVEHLIQRQTENGDWSFNPRSADRYRMMLREIAISFARFAARLERRYIFAWLDWDGDNVLASAGIIDYGSIRQFGLRHDQYRYDDVTRFSTNLNEQRGKARQTVQVFAQLVDFLESGDKKQLQKYVNHEACRVYDREFDRELRREFLLQVGLEQAEAELILSKEPRRVERLYNSFLRLETTKSKCGLKKLPDGVNRPACYNMRRVLRELPTLVAQKSGWTKPANETLLELMRSSFAKRYDLKLKGGLRQRLEEFSQAYVDFLRQIWGDQVPGTARLRQWQQRAKQQSLENRLTGNASEYMVEELIKARRRGLSYNEVRRAMELLIAAQAPQARRVTRPVASDSPAGQLFSRLMNLAQEFEEDI